MNAGDRIIWSGDGDYCYVVPESLLKRGVHLGVEVDDGNSVEQCGLLILNKRPPTGAAPFV